MGTKKVRKVILEKILVSILIYLLIYYGHCDWNKIEEYMKYKDKLEYEKKIDKQILDAVDNYIKKRKSINDIIEETFGKTEFIIEEPNNI